MTTVQISKDDIFYATQWLFVKLEEQSWLSDKFDDVLTARQEFKKIKHSSKPEKIQAFCDKWLSSRQAGELDKSLCLDRKRRRLENKDKPVSVEMTERASMILNRLAQQENCSTSEVIEKYMFDHVVCDEH
ncbi:MAG: hypothetical protein OEY89_04670 [Gammaproteobacteria bacterium]|nr:hypothetical protein [Gammaproteobacteria bacterium]